jgi:enoyl-[acyl-carrier protein] reductase III
VTGASRGIGRAIALKLAASGAEIAAGYFNAHREAETLCEEIDALGGRARAFQVNVADPDSVAAMLEGVGAAFDGLDILVSNAASGVLRPSHELTLKHWRWCLETNALALHSLTKSAASLLRADAVVIALSSLGAGRVLPDYAFVGASKAALESLVRSLAADLGPRGVRVNAVSAGVVDTDALKAFPARNTLIAEFGRRAPMRRLVSAEEVAGAVYLLCLPEARMITGQTLVVDGGYSIVA